MTWRGRNIYLVGMPGSGKSAIGRALYKRLSPYGYFFIDLDEEIERTLGRTIPEIFRNGGEESFREAETAVLECVGRTAFTGVPSIVATGGGSVLRPINRAIMRGSGITVHVDVTIRQAASRISKDIRDGKERPLFALDEEEAVYSTLREMLEARRPFYEDSVLHFVTRDPADTERIPEELGEEMFKALEAMSLRVALKPKFQTLVAKSALGDYPISIGNGITSFELPRLVTEQAATSVMLVTDANVADLHLAAVRKALSKTNVRLTVFTLEPGEASKSHETLTAMLHGFDDAGISRKRGLVVSLGGGVVSDISGFAASINQRGTPVVHVPTSLLAQVDAAIGGKTGINFGGKKNTIGSFFPPRAVLIDPLLLRTLPEREFLSGLSELVKYGIISSSTLWEELEDRWQSIYAGTDKLLPRLIASAIQEKLRIIACDEFERSGDGRELLNFGHTFAHALESLTCFEVFTHGEAVAIGMRTACWLSKELGYLGNSEFDRIDLILAKLHTRRSISLNRSNIVSAMYKDKKSAGLIRLILTKGIGSAFALDCDEADILPAIDYLLSLL